MIDIFAMITSLLGATLMATGKPSLIPATMVFYIIGSILWISVGITMGMVSLIITNIVFIILEVLALFKWIEYNKSKGNKK